MATKITQYAGLYGDDQKRLYPDFVHCELLETRSEKHNWQIDPHIHNDLVQIFCFEEGNARIIGEQQQWTSQGASFVVIPDNTLHGFEFVAGLRGIVLSISTSYWEKLLANSPAMSLAFAQIGLIPLPNNLGKFGQLTQLLGKITEEIGLVLPEKSLLLQALLSTFLVELYRELPQETNQVTGKRSLAIFRQFLKDIKEAYSPLKSLRSYADNQHISLVHLNRVCQHVANQSATLVVHHFFVEEAKKYLLYTNLSVAEVAYQLNFEDPAYFSRLFKKLVGVSPKTFQQHQKPLYF